MKKDKVAAIIVFLVILFIVFVFGLFIGKRLSPKSSKEGTIKESALKNKNNIPAGHNASEQTPASTDNIKFAPISKLSAPQKSKISETQSSSQVQQTEIKQVVKPKVETKIVYVKKPVYVYKYKYLTKKVPVGNRRVSHINSRVHYTIQVAALKYYGQAKALAVKLNSMGFFAYVIPVTIHGKSGNVVYQQVRVGKFATVGGAESIKNIISKKFNVKPYIVKVY